MALGSGVAAGIAGGILFIVVLCGCYLKKNPDFLPKYTLDDKFHPIARWVIFGLMIVSWIFSVAVTASCTFLKYEDKVSLNNYGGDDYYSGGDDYYSGGYYYSGGGPSNPAYYRGFNSDEDPTNGECVPFDWSEGLMLEGALDARMLPAFIFAIVNCLATTICVIYLALMQFVFVSTERREKTWSRTRYTTVMTLFFCLFTFFLQGSLICKHYACSLGPAGVAQVFNVLFLIAIVGLLYVTPFGEAKACGSAKEDDDAEKGETEVGGEDGNEKK
eukprot:scaffold2214_cov139-Cylindrotheca_fusiformis.AAC.3